MALYGEKTHFKVIGKQTPRVDGFEKVTGKALYAADVYKDKMIYGGCKRIEEYPAKVTAVHTTKALSIPGVLKIYTCFDAPKKQSWADYYYLTEDVQFCGDVVAIVAAETKEIVEKALEAITVDYDLVDGVYTIDDALKPEAPVIREKGVGLVDGIPAAGTKGNVFLDSYYPIRKGNVEEGFKNSDVILQREYRVPFIEHAYIEPEAVVIYTDMKDGSITAEASAQNPFFSRRYLADSTGYPINECRLIQRMLGGSFGGKEEGVGCLIGRAAMLHVATGRPIKMVNSREESLMDSGKRHPFRLNYKVGVTKDGKIQALEGTLVDNCGAYNNQTQFMNWRASVHSGGVYEIPNVKTDTYGVFTNNVHSGAMRGYSSPQLIFAQEQLYNEVAAELGMDPVEFRKKNILRQNAATITGQVLKDEVILADMVDTLLEKSNYYEKKKECDAFNAVNTKVKRGISLVTSYRGAGLGAETVDASGAFVQATEDGTFIVSTGLAENGQGLQTAFAQIAAEGLGVGVDAIHFHSVDTHAIADSGMTVASRGTTMGAQSMRTAGIKLGLMLKETAAEKLGVAIEHVDVNDGVFFIKDDFRSVSEIEEDKARTVTMAEVCNTRLWSGDQMAIYDWYKPAPIIFDHHTGQGDSFPAYTFNTCVAEVEVDMETGYVHVPKVYSGIDCGTVINPDTVKGQMYGGIAMGQGFAVSEEVEVNKGKIGNPNFDSYIFPTSMDIPEMDLTLFESDSPEGTYGAKSVGEPSTEAVGAAIAGAVTQALDKRIYRLPCDLERVLLGKSLRPGGDL